MAAFDRRNAGTSHGVAAGILVHESLPFECLLVELSQVVTPNGRGPQAGHPRRDFPATRKEAML